jgi:Bacterial Ig-like domain (group 3)
VTITQTTTTTVTSSADPSVAGQAVTFTATVSAVPDGGTVAFYQNGTPITACAAQQVDTSTGTATCQVTFDSAGTYVITSIYSGYSVFGISVGDAVQTVNP